MSRSRPAEMKASLEARYEAAVNDQDLELLDRQLTRDCIDRAEIR